MIKQFQSKRLCILMNHTGMPHLDETVKQPILLFAEIATAFYEIIASPL